MVRGIVYHVVADIAENKPGKNGQQPCRAQGQPEKAVKEQSEGNAHDGGHNQASRVVWIVMVNPVHQKMDVVAERLRNRFLRTLVLKISILGYLLDFGTYNI